MSEDTNPTNDIQITPKPSATPTSDAVPTPAASKPRRTWKRRLVRLAIFAVVASVILRICLTLLFGTVVSKVASFYGLRVEYDRKEIALLSGDAGLWKLKIFNQDSIEALVSADYVRGNISTLALLTGRLHVWRLEADGAEVDLERTPDGHLPTLELVLKNLVTPAATGSNAVENASDKEIDKAARPIDFRSPFQVDAIRVQHLKVNWHDRALSPQVNVSVSMNLRISELRSELPVRIEGEVWSDQLLDVMRFEGQSMADGRKLDLAARVSGRGLNLRPLAPYLRAAGIDPSSQGLDWSGKLTIATDAGPTPTGIKGTLVLSDIESREASGEPFAMKKLELVADSIDASGARFSKLAISGVRVAVQIDAKVPMLAGYSIVAPEPMTAPFVWPMPASVAASVTTSANDIVPNSSTKPASSFALSLGEFRVNDVELSLSDLSAGNRLALTIDEFVSEQISTDSSGRRSVPFRGKMRSPGIAGAIDLSGNVFPFASPYKIDASFDAKEIALSAVEVYFRPLGIEPTFDQGTLKGKVSAQIEAGASGEMTLDARLFDVELFDGRESLVMPLAQVKQLSLNKDQTDFKVADIEITGPSLVIRREPSGVLSTVGLRFVGPPKSGASPVNPSAATTPMTLPATVPTTQATETIAQVLPRFQLDKFTWSGADIRLEDQMQTPAKVLRVVEPRIELQNIVVDLTGKNVPTAPGTISVNFSVPGLLGNAMISGTVIPGQDRARSGFEWALQDMNLTDIDAYLRPLGVVPTLQKGSASGRVVVDVVKTQTAIALELSGEDFALQSDSTTLAGVKRFSLSGVSLSSNGLTLGDVKIESPAIEIARDADGAFRALGLSIPASEKVGVPEAAPAVGPHFIPIPELPLPITLSALSVSGASINWRDDFMAGPVELGLTVDASATNLSTAAGAASGTLSAHLRLPGVIDSLNVDASASLNPFDLRLDATAVATGISGDRLEPYLPAGVRLTLDRATFDGQAAFRLVTEPSHQSVEFTAASVALRQDNSMLLGAEQVEVIAPRLIARELIELHTVRVVGAQTQLAFLHDGTLKLPGVSLVPVAESSDSKVQSDPNDQAIAIDLSGKPDQVDAAAVLAGARPAMPLIKLDSLSLGLSRVSIRDDSRPESVDLTLADVALTNVSPIEIGGPDAEARPPFDLKVRGRIDPLVGSLAVDARLQPFASEALAQVKFDASQVNGAGLVKLVPELAGTVSGDALIDGKLTASLDAKIRFQKRGATSIDLRRGFEGEVSMREIEYRAQTGGDVLAGVQGVTIESLKVNPNFAGGSARSLEITSPLFRITRDAGGIQVLGWTIADPLRTKADAEASTQIAVSSESVAQVRPAQAISQPKSETNETTSEKGGEFVTPEWKIDRLLITGLDVLIRDTSVTPQLTIPLNNLDVEVKGLSTRAFDEPRPLRFNALVGSGKVLLPSRTRPGEFEEREFLSQATASGVLLLAPKLDGYAKLGVTGVELAALQGIARDLTGVDLSDGLFDGSIDLRFRDGGNLDLRSKFVLSDLSVSDSSDGIIRSTLKLPTPLELGIKAVEDPSGAITLPISVPIRAGEVSWGGVIGSGIAGVGQVITTAIVSAPLKLIPNFGQKESKTLPPVVLMFDPGDTGLEAGNKQMLDELLAAMQEDRKLAVQIEHTLGGGDIERAAGRANPTPEVAKSLASELRQRQDDALSRRSVVSARARAAAVTGGDQRSLDGLTQLDHELASIADQLDRILELQRVGSDLQAPRRTRAAALDVANARVDLIRRYLIDAGIRDAASRVNFKNPVWTTPSSDQKGMITLTLESQKRAK